MLFSEFPSGRNNDHPVGFHYRNQPPAALLASLLNSVLQACSR